MENSHLNTFPLQMALGMWLLSYSLACFHPFQVYYIKDLHGVWPESLSEDNFKQRISS